MIVFDTYAWIEYFRGTEEGRAAKMYVESNDEIAVSSLCLAEIRIKYGREGHDAADKLRFILSRSIVVDVTGEIALLAAEQRLKHGLYIVDALMYATALRFNSKLLTGDRHFQKLENAEFMEK